MSRIPQKAQLDQTSAAKAAKMAHSADSAGGELVVRYSFDNQIDKAGSEDQQNSQEYLSDHQANGQGGRRQAKTGKRARTLEPAGPMEVKNAALGQTVAILREELAKANKSNAAKDASIAEHKRATESRVKRILEQAARIVELEKANARLAQEKAQIEQEKAQAARLAVLEQDNARLEEEKAQAVAT